MLNCLKRPGRSLIMSRNNVDIFRILLCELMLNRMDELEKDRVQIINNISLRTLNHDRYYDLIVNDIRTDYARVLFRQIRTLLDTYLDD